MVATEKQFNYFGKTEILITGINPTDYPAPNGFESQHYDLWSIPEFPRFGKALLFVNAPTDVTNTIEANLEFSIQDKDSAGNSLWVTIASMTVQITTLSSGQAIAFSGATYPPLGRFVRIRIPTVGTGNVLDVSALIT